MTADDHRQFLNSRGYSVPRNSFPGDRGPSWCIVDRNSPPPPGAEHRWDMHYFIDLNTGEWRPWHRNKWKPFHTGPWNELAEDSAPAQASEIPAVDSHRNHPFILRCLAAGFVLDDAANAQPGKVAGEDLGNRWAMREGQRWLISTATHRVIDARMNKREITEFESAERVEKPVPSMREITPESKPLVSMRDVPIVSTGRAKQAALFS